MKKYMILGVANNWEKRKGLDVFFELAQGLDAEVYQIVLGGTNEKVDRTLPQNIISIHQTSNQRELSELFSSADLFVNPTREDNFPTVNLEALACGTPVLTFRTGGSPEMLDESCGSTVECGDVDALEAEIVRICENRPFSKESCLRRSKDFDSIKTYLLYLKLFDDRVEDIKNENCIC